VLAGGRAARLGGRPKPQLEVGGRTMLAAVLAATADAAERIVVGPPQPVPDGVRLLREHPPGGGPVAALRAGLAEVGCDVVAVLAADLPFLTRDDVGTLQRGARDRAGAVYVDDGDRPQWLTGVWRTAALRTALAGYPGASLRGLMDPLDPARVRAAERRRPAWYDCDTEDDVVQASRLIEENDA
jgi:molybdopterin-guanine dinucleotide biosynthesis protein A